MKKAGRRLPLNRILIRGANSIGKTDLTDRLVVRRLSEKIATAILILSLRQIKAQNYR